MCRDHEAGHAPWRRALGTVRRYRGWIGFRFNTEGAGPGPIDLRIYRITYADGEKSKNRLPNAGFDAGLDHWATYSTGRITTPISDRGDGRTARIRASATEWVLIDAYGIGVTPGSIFRVTVAA
jgi:hypothetical protein